MCRSFVLLTFLGALFSTLYSKTAAKKILPEFRSGDKNFSLTCLLFGDTGCDLECLITSRIYDYHAEGECVKIKKQKNICECSIAEPIPSYVTWKKKFDSDYVYNRIMMNSQRAQEAEKILLDPNTTGQDLKKRLRPLLSPYQYSKLKLNDNSPAAKSIKNGEVDRQSMRKFISDQLDALFKRSWNKSRSLLRMNYRLSFKNDLQNVRDIGTMYNFVYKVTGLGNEALKKELEEYLDKRDIAEPELEPDEEPLVSSILHYLILNEFIKRNDAETRTSPKQDADIEDE